MGRCFECRYHGGRIRRSPEHHHPVRLSAIELNAFADNTSSSGSCHSCSSSAVFLHCLDTYLIPFLRVSPQVLEQRNTELACFLHLQTASGLIWSSGVGYIIVARHTSHGICLTSRIAAQESDSYDHQRAVARSVPRYSLSHAHRTSLLTWNTTIITAPHRLLLHFPSRIFLERSRKETVCRRGTRLESAFDFLRYCFECRG
jgi:hypothetical protein